VKILVYAARVIKRFFYVFLDVSGIALGIFLLVLGFWMAAGWVVSPIVGLITLFLGLCAVFIHAGHYFQLRISKWLFGNDYFLVLKKMRYIGNTPAAPSLVGLRGYYQHKSHKKDGL